MPGNNAAPVTTTIRSLEIIELLHERPGATLTEIAEALDLPSSTTHDHLSTLVDRGYLTREDRTYYVSLGFLTLGGKSRSRSQLYNAAERDVRSLAYETGEQANLMVERDGRGIYLIKQPGPDSLPLDSYEGMEAPLHATAMGKAILAELSEKERERIVDEHGLPAVTETTITDRTELASELETIRERGYAVDDEERADGIRCIATSIVSDGEVVGALSLSGPSGRMTDDRFSEELLPKIRSTGNIIESKLQHSGDVPTARGDDTADQADADDVWVRPQQIQSEFEHLASDTDMEVLQDSTVIQAVESSDGTQFAGAFWTSEVNSVGNVTADGLASVVVDERGDTTEIRVADPTHKQDTVTVTVRRVDPGATDPYNKDPGITITNYKPLVLEVAFDGRDGETQSITFGEPGLVDRCADCSHLADGSDTQRLKTVSGDPENFERPDGSHDADRLIRDGTTGDTTVIYDPPGAVVDLAAEFHWADGAGGDLEIYESSDGGHTWSPVSQSVTEYTTADAGDWHSELHEYGSFSAGTSHVKLVLTGGSEDWSGQLGHVELGYTEPPLIDRCADLSMVAADSDTDNLTLDTNNTGDSFLRPNGRLNGTRITRDGTTDDTALVYSLAGHATDLTVEFHWFDDEGGDLDIYESTDGGDTWSQASKSVEEYHRAESGSDVGWRSELHEYSSFSRGVDRVKLVLAGGNGDWSGQIGTVEIDYDPSPLTDHCGDLTRLAAASDTEQLTVGSESVQDFDRFDGTVDQARIRREDTTADAALVYDPLGTVVDLSVEFHWHDQAGGDLEIRESTDGGDSWTTVEQSVTEYDTVEVNWHSEIHEYSAFSDGTGQVKLVLTDGSEDWSGQIGHVDIDVD